MYQYPFCTILFSEWWVYGERQVRTRTRALAALTGCYTWPGTANKQTHRTQAEIVYVKNTNQNGMKIRMKAILLNATLKWQCQIKNLVVDIFNQRSLYIEGVNTLLEYSPL